MSMNRVDSTALRTEIRRLAVSDLANLSRLGAGDLSLTTGDLLQSVTTLGAILEALNDYEARLPKIIQSARAAQADHLV